MSGDVPDPTGDAVSAEPLPDWLRPPPGGFTADDLDRLRRWATLAARARG